MPVKAKPRNDGEVTRMRLLGAACSVFSAKGFRDATVQEICRQAEVNPALISYHFGDKASLYEAVWRHCVKRARQHYPVDGGAGEHAPVEHIIHFTMAGIAAMRQQIDLRES
ncbi:MAG: TetR/AcrR family transcriptional regulator [Verrucomicrobiales bacterium]